jgi:peroxiredoxin
LLSFTALKSQKLKLKVGKKVPGFTLETNTKDQFSLAESLSEGRQIVLVFYQGRWNSYDMKYLSKLQEIKAQVEEKGATIVLVTRETHAYSKHLKDEGIDLLVCQDPDWYIMSNYGVVYKLSKGNLPDKYKSYSSSNYKHTGSKDDMVPVPATFVIGTDQKVKYVHFDLDYRQHPPVSEILNAL